VQTESIESDHLQLHYTVMERLSDELRTSQRSELDSLKPTAQQLSTAQLQAYNDANAAKPP